MIKITIKKQGDIINLYHDKTQFASVYPEHDNIIFDNFLNSSAIIFGIGEEIDHKLEVEKQGLTVDRIREIASQIL